MVPFNIVAFSFYKRNPITSMILVYSFYFYIMEVISPVCP